MIKNVKLAELSVTIITAFLNTQISREYKRLCSSKNYQQELDEKLNEKFLIHINFLTMIRISLCYRCKTAFVFINIWIIEKKLMKRHYLNNKIFIVTYIWKILVM